jgi:hypothetical protein
MSPASQEDDNENHDMNDLDVGFTVTAPSAIDPGHLMQGPTGETQDLTITGPQEPFVTDGTNRPLS